MFVEFIIIVQALFFFLPAYAANMAPVIFSKVKILQPLKIPINTKLFGAHKTYYGFCVGIGLAVFVGLLEALYGKYFSVLSDHDSFGAKWWIYLSFLMGFGALFGDLIKSFFKRRLGISSGALFVPFDQIDFIIGTLFILYFFGIFSKISQQFVLPFIFFSPFLQVLSNLIAYKLGLKKVWW